MVWNNTLFNNIRRTMPSNTKQSNEKQSNARRRKATQKNKQCNAIQSDAIQCKSKKYIASHQKLQHVARFPSPPPECFGNISKKPFTMTFEKILETRQVHQYILCNCSAWSFAFDVLAPQYCGMPNMSPRSVGYAELTHTPPSTPCAGKRVTSTHDAGE